LRFDARYLAIDMVRLKQGLNETRILGIIFQKQDPKRRGHESFLALPGGG